MSTNFFNAGIFDTAFIKRTEGYELYPYVPPKSSTSGVTIASGIDVKSGSTEKLKGMTNTAQQALLKSADGLIGNSARAWVNTYKSSFGRLSVTDYKIIMNNYYNSVYHTIKADCSSFLTLPSALRTAAFDLSMFGIYSVFYQHGMTYICNNNANGLIAYIKTTSLSSDRKSKLINLLSNLASSQVSTSLDSSKKVTTTATNTALAIAIGNEIILSDYENNSTSQSYFKSIFTKSGLTDSQSNILLGALGLDDSAANSYVNKYSTFTLSQDNCDNLLIQILYEHKTRLKNNYGIELSDNPIEVNTALMSFIFDKNLNDADTLKDEVDPVAKLAKSKSYNALATAIEADGATDLDRYKTRRTEEATLIRNRISDTPNYVTDTTSAANDPDAFFANKQSQLDSDVAYAKANYEAIKASKSIDYSSTDDVYESISNADATNFAQLLELHQIVTDNFYSDEDSEYVKRSDVKALYNSKTRSYNKTYYAIESMLEEDGDSVDLLSSIYEYIPYGTDLFYDIKLAAVNRAKYRIKKLEYEINQIEGEVSSYGIFDFTLTNTQLAILAITMPVVAAALLILQALFASHTEKATLLTNEQANLILLNKELNRFTKSN